MGQHFILDSYVFSNMVGGSTRGYVGENKKNHLRWWFQKLGLSVASRASLISWAFWTLKGLFTGSTNLMPQVMKTTVFSMERWNLSFQTSVQLTGTETSIGSGFIHSRPF